MRRLPLALLFKGSGFGQPPDNPCPRESVAGGGGRGGRQSPPWRGEADRSPSSSAGPEDVPSAQGPAAPFAGACRLSKARSPPAATHHSPSRHLSCPQRSPHTPLRTGATCRRVPAPAPAPLRSRAPLPPPEVLPGAGRGRAARGGGTALPPAPPPPPTPPPARLVMRRPRGAAGGEQPEEFVCCLLPSP